ncbi:hypothetical protein Murmansk-016 [Murmansk poxvirus]|uniref:Interleukin-18-binding protein n=1 Tax=Murmansk poxvirus TaxID=2025359 RepID=A0A223FMJ6_9POXV|nr:hypothetical protein CKM52_gp016 [Murmansk poxvirus]AST09211.1 hypothetical protein Murmansk-016 [Murmansk poxvirus]
MKQLSIILILSCIHTAISNNCPNIQIERTPTGFVCNACQLFPAFDILYWLGKNNNGTNKFISRLGEGIHEEKTIYNSRNMTTFLTITNENKFLDTEFTCVFSSPAMVSKKNIFIKDYKV